MSFSKRFMSGSPFRVDKANVKVPAKIKAPVETPMTESEKKLMHATMSVNDKYAVDLGTVKNTKKKESPLNVDKATINAAIDNSSMDLTGFRGARTNLINPDSPGSKAMRDAYEADWGEKYDLNSPQALSYAISYYGNQGDAARNLREINPDMSHSEIVQESRRLRDEAFGQGGNNSDELQGLQDEVNVSRNANNTSAKSPSTSRSRAAWNQYGDDLNSLTAERRRLEDSGLKGSNEWNINQNKINELYGVSKRYSVIDEEVVNPDNVEVITDVVDPNAHVPAEGINVMSRKQRRAAKRVAKLEAKNRNQGSLTEGQSKRLNRNISKAKGEDVAMADRTKLGQIANQAGDALGIIPDEEEVV